MKKIKYKILKQGDKFIIKVKMNWLFLWQWKIITDNIHPDGTKPASTWNTFEEARQWMEQPCDEYNFQIS